MKRIAATTISVSRRQWCNTRKGSYMKKIIDIMLGKKPLETVGLVILTIVLYGAIALMMLLYAFSPTISGERMF